MFNAIRDGDHEEVKRLLSTGGYLMNIKLMIARVIFRNSSGTIHLSVLSRHGGKDRGYHTHRLVGIISSKLSKSSMRMIHSLPLLLTPRRCIWQGIIPMRQIMVSTRETKRGSGILS